MSVLSVCRFQQTDKTDKNDKTDMLFFEVVVGKYADTLTKGRRLAEPSASTKPMS